MVKFYEENTFLVNLLIFFVLTSLGFGVILTTVIMILVAVAMAMANSERQRDMEKYMGEPVIDPDKEPNCMLYFKKNGKTVDTQKIHIVDYVGAKTYIDRLTEEARADNTLEYDRVDLDFIIIRRVYR